MLSLEKSVLRQISYHICLLSIREERQPRDIIMVYEKLTKICQFTINRLANSQIIINIIKQNCYLGTSYKAFSSLWGKYDIVGICISYTAVERY